MTPVTPDLLRANPLAEHHAGQDKDARGTVLVLGGSVEVPGGALLAGVAALRAGAGKLQVATCRSVAPHMALAVPEARVIGLAETEAGGIAPGEAAAVAKLASRAAAVLLGPGMLDPEATAALVGAVLEQADGPPLVLDAEAIHALSGEALRPHAGRAVITPHTGEMARLLGVKRDEVEADKLAAAREAAARLRCVVVMKGGQTEVVSPGGEAWLYDGGTVGLATSGSGDVLAGVIAGLLARGAPPLWAAMWGVYLHGEAGVRLMRRYGGVGFLAREVSAEVPRIMAELGPAK